MVGNERLARGADNSGSVLLSNPGAVGSLRAATGAAAAVSRKLTCSAIGADGVGRAQLAGNRATACNSAETTNAAVSRRLGQSAPTMLHPLACKFIVLCYATKLSDFTIKMDTSQTLRCDHPLILTLDANGVPHRWITWQHAVFYYAKDLVAWAAGDSSFAFFGGISRLTGRRSTIVANSIIAIKGKAVAARSLMQVPPLNNRELFHRDRHLCGYCGGIFSGLRLTRDHITPVSQGGRDTWMNVVTACRSCNQRKSGRTPEQASMQLLYTPYVPNKAEYLILCNRNILADQMDFLARHVAAQSRWKPC